MASRAKLYDNSPTTKRGDDGKVGISRPSKADGNDMGVSGGPALQGGGNGMPVDKEHPQDMGGGDMEAHVAAMHERHMREMKDMHKRHEDEHSDMHKRHQKEHETLHKIVHGEKKPEHKE